MLHSVGALLCRVAEPACLYCIPFSHLAQLLALCSAELPFAVDVRFCNGFLATHLNLFSAGHVLSHNEKYALFKLSFSAER